MANLLFFPQPFPDESLHSLAVRYHKLAANPSYRLTSHELFGSYSRTCGSILPCCLGVLSERLRGAISVGELIERFTLFPLYLPFLNEEKGRDAAFLMGGNRVQASRWGWGLQRHVSSNMPRSGTARVALGKLRSSQHRQPDLC